MKILTQYLLFASLCSPLVVIGGCAGSGPKGPSTWSMPWSKKDKPPKPYPNPVKMAVTWTPDTLVQSGRTPTRGFGGRLFFYDEKTRPVPVEGELTVHAFAENADGSMGEVKRYHFTPEQFTQHFSQSDLGASYSVWIPWDAVGGDQMRISLVPSFRTAAGRLVQGEQALVGLPGRRNAVEQIAKRPDRVSELLASRDTSKSGLTTTTIPIRRELESQTQLAGTVGPALGGPVLGGPVLGGPVLGGPVLGGPVSPAVGGPANAAGGAALAAAEPQPTNAPERKRTLRLGQSISPASAELPLD